MALGHEESLNYITMLQDTAGRYDFVVLTRPTIIYTRSRCTELLPSGDEYALPLPYDVSLKMTIDMHDSRQELRYTP